RRAVGLQGTNWHAVHRRTGRPGDEHLLIVFVIRKETLELCDVTADDLLGRSAEEFRHLGVAGVDTPGPSIDQRHSEQIRPEQVLEAIPAECIRQDNPLSVRRRSVWQPCKTDYERRV